MYYEIYVNSKNLKDGCYVLSDNAVHDLMDFETKENT